MTDPRTAPVLFSGGQDVIDKAASWALAEPLGGQVLTALIVEHSHSR